MQHHVILDRQHVSVRARCCLGCFVLCAAAVPAEPFHFSQLALLPECLCFCQRLHADRGRMLTKPLKAVIPAFFLFNYTHI